ncbi:C-X-C chemokine receptor type 6 [Emydura macquarii macquarii]|uniref:C-X-C chemokine receptor type 6 n=1 Tax=Emydura macquarii macquarii TaxID=1129001 RepID=UPI00352A2A49
MDIPDYYHPDLNLTCNDYNENDNFLRASKIFLPFMYALTFAFGLIGNSLVLFIYIFCDKLKTLTDVFLVSLATADLLFLSTLPFWAYSAAHEWIFGSVMCKIIRGLYTLNLYTSMLTLTCITIDRFIAIAQATKAHVCQAKRMVWGKVICILVWVISLAFAIPQFKYSTQSDYDKSICHAMYPSHLIELVFKVLQMTLGFFIPMLTMIICYSIIIKTLLHARSFQKHKSLKIIFSVVAVFILTQLPYNLLILLRNIHLEFYLDYDFDYAVVITEAIAYLHSCLNPVLYFFIGVKFRKNFRKIIKKIRCTKRQGIVKQWQTMEEEGSKTSPASHNVEATSMYPL